MNSPPSAAEGLSFSKVLCESDNCFMPENRQINYGAMRPNTGDNATTEASHMEGFLLLFFPHKHANTRRKMKM